MSTLRTLLALGPLTEVVDVGASALDGEPPPYASLLAAGLCRVTGFEPQPAALIPLDAHRGANERYFPYVIGDGGDHVLHVCAGTGMTSLLEPDPVTLAMFAALQLLGEVVARVPVTTRRLDDVDEVARIDWLKLDVQGGELAVLRSAPVKLARAVAVHVEVSFIPLYRDQPGMGAIDLELRGQGFLPHGFLHMKQWPLAPSVANIGAGASVHQMIDADLLYVRDVSTPEAMTDDQLRHLALIADHAYGSFDLALRCISSLVQRGAVAPDAEIAYLDDVQARRA